MALTAEGLTALYHALRAHVRAGVEVTATGWQRENPDIMHPQEAIVVQIERPDGAVGLITVESAGSKMSVTAAPPYHAHGRAWPLEIRSGATGYHWDGAGFDDPASLAGMLIGRLNNELDALSRRFAG